MLAQDGDSYSVDFRTTDTNVDNAKGQPSLLGPAGNATTAVTHLAVTWSSASAQLNLYINGVWISSIDRTGTVNQGWEGGLPLRLGYELNTDGSPVSAWQGEVYLVAMYNRLLSDDEIYQNYKAGY
jgi:hypothetical protein